MNNIKNKNNKLKTLITVVLHFSTVNTCWCTMHQLEMSDLGDYLCSENKGPDLRLCFCICKIAGFLRGSIIDKLFYEFITLR